MFTTLGQQNPGSWTRFVQQKPKNQCETLTFSDTDEHVIRTFQLRQFWSVSPEGVEEYREWQQGVGKFVARVSHVGGDGPERQRHHKYRNYTPDELCEMFARNKTKYPVWMLNLFLFRPEQVQAEARRDFLERKFYEEPECHSSKQSDMETMTADEIWDKVNQTVKLALQSFRDACGRVPDQSGNTEYSDGSSLLRAVEDGRLLSEVFSETLLGTRSSKDSQSVEH